METNLTYRPMRASQFELCQKCRGAFWLSSHGSEYSIEGKAFHELLSSQLSRGNVTIQDLAVKYGLNEDQQKDLFFAQNKIRFEIPAGARIFPETTLKASINEYPVEGTPDLVIYSDDSADLTDYKFGLSPVSPAKENGQIMLYCFLIFANHPETQKITARIIQPRLAAETEHTFERAEFMETILPGILVVVSEVHDNKFKTEYTYGPHCRSCFSNMDCPAFGKQIVRFANMASEKAIDSTEEALKVLIPLSKACQQMINRVDLVAKEFVRKFGKVVFADGSEYVRERQFREKLEPEQTIHALKDFFDWNEIIDMMKFTKTEITDRCREKGRGISTKVFNALNEAGAISIEETERFVIKKPEKNKEAVNADQKKSIG